MTAPDTFWVYPRHRLEPLRGMRAGPYSIRGEVLLEDFMKPRGLSRYRVAHDISVPPLRISQIVRGRRAISVDTAMRLARYFGTSAEVWLRMQARYDLAVGQRRFARRIEREVKALSPESSSPSH